VAFARHGGALPAAQLDEHWRHATVDFSAPESAERLRSPDWVRDISKWLIAAQPISVAVNDDAGFTLAREIFERTAVVVFTAGTLDAPALTCQARPQDGEVFGEVPPRRSLRAHTRCPVLVPSPTPGYNAGFADAHLEARGRAWAAEGPPAGTPPAAAALLTVLDPSDLLTRGFCAELLDYLTDACADNPRRGAGAGRTTLFGLQRTPLADGDARAHTVLRLSAGASAALAVPHLLPLVSTNAAAELRVSVDPEAPAARELAAALVSSGAVPAAQVSEDTAAAFEARVASEDPFNVVDGAALADLAEARAAVGFPLAGHFASTLLCFGHAKSTRPGDEAFVRAFADSPKWLKMAPAAES